MVNKLCLSTKIVQNGSKIGRFGGGGYLYSDWTGYDKLTAITQWGDFNGLTAINKLGEAELTGVPSDLPSTVTNTNHMFFKCHGEPWFSR